MRNYFPSNHSLVTLCAMRMIDARTTLAAYFRYDKCVLSLIARGTCSFAVQSALWLLLYGVVAIPISGPLDTLRNQGHVASSAPALCNSPRPLTTFRLSFRCIIRSYSPRRRRSRYPTCALALTRATFAGRAGCYEIFYYAVVIYDSRIITNGITD